MPGIKGGVIVSRKIHVLEHGVEEGNFIMYSFTMPTPGENDYKRSIAYFRTLFKPRGSNLNSMTDRRTMMAFTDEQIHDIDRNFSMPRMELKDIFDFFREIGWDYKKRKYITGERPLKA